MTTNPFAKLKKKSFKSELVKGGTYYGVVANVSTKEVPSKFDQDETSTRLILKFKVQEDGKEIYIPKFLFASLNPKSKFALFLRSVSPLGFPEAVFRDAETLWQAVQALLGTKVIISVSAPEEGWNNIISVIPNPDSAPAITAIDGKQLVTPIAAPKPGKGHTNIDVDDIPF